MERKCSKIITRHHKNQRKYKITSGQGSYNVAEALHNIPNLEEYLNAKLNLNEKSKHKFHKIQPIQLTLKTQQSLDSIRVPSNVEVGRQCLLSSPNSNNKSILIQYSVFTNYINCRVKRNLLRSQNGDDIFIVISIQKCISGAEYIHGGYIYVTICMWVCMYVWVCGWMYIYECVYVCMRTSRNIIVNLIRKP